MSRREFPAKIAVELLHPDARIPAYAHDGDAGADLYSVETVFIEPGHCHVVSTGLALAIPRGFVGLVHPRSGLAANYGITVLNAPGTIDSGYRGPVKVNLINHSDQLYRVQIGDRIAQLVIQQVETASFFGVDTLPEASDSRGVAGHGSTGL